METFTPHICTPTPTPNYCFWLGVAVFSGEENSQKILHYKMEIKSHGKLHVTYSGDCYHTEKSALPEPDKYLENLN